MQAVSLSGSRKCRDPADNAIKGYASKDTARSLHVIDGKGLELGQLASQVAKLLRGRHKPIFTPSTDVGDYVVVVNAALIHVAGNKSRQARNYRHAELSSAIERTAPKQILGERFPEKVLEKAVLRILPREAPLARAAFKRLRVCAGPDHVNKARQSNIYDFAGKNPKNVAGSNQMASTASQAMEVAAEKVGKKYFEKSKLLINNIDVKISALQAGQTETNARLEHLENGQRETNELLKSIRDMISRMAPNP